MYTRLQTVWSLPGHSRQDNKGLSPRCHRRPNGAGRLADKGVQPTTQSAEGCTVSLDSSDTRRRGGGSDTQGRGGRVVVALPSPLGPAATAQLTRSGSLGLSNFRG